MTINQLNPPEPGSPKWHKIGLLKIRLYDFDDFKLEWRMAGDEIEYAVRNIDDAKRIYNRLVSERVVNNDHRHAPGMIESDYYADVPAWKRSEWGCDEELYGDFNGEYYEEYDTDEVWCLTPHNLLTAEVCNTFIAKTYVNNWSVPEEYRRDGDDEVWQ